MAIANPLIAQGTLNRLRGSITVPTFPILNVTAPYLGKAGISIALQGDTTTYIETLTGAVTSPEPYQRVSVTVHLLKTQGLAAQYKAQMESLSTIGSMTIVADASTYPDYTFVNCSIMSLGELSYAGDNADFPVVLGGFYNINSQLWNLN
jgi:hypothetical protein